MESWGEMDGVKKPEPIWHTVKLSNAKEGSKSRNTMDATFFHNLIEMVLSSLAIMLPYINTHWT